MQWLWLLFAAVAAFAVLSAIGNERQKLVDEKAALTPAPSPDSDAPPTLED